MNEKKQFQIHLNPLFVILLIIQIVIMTLIVLSVSKILQTNNYDNNPNQGPFAKIESISTIIPEDYPEWANLIEWALFNTALDNTESQSISEISATAHIREETIKKQYFEEQNSSYVRAIIDIPELSQSYEIFLEYPNIKDAVGVIEYNEPDIAKPYSILCLDNPAEIIYPEFDCQESSTYFTRQEIVSKTLNYFDFNDFAPSFKDRDLSTIYIYPFNYDINNSTKQSYIQETRDAINSLGISPDIFNYHVVEQNELDYTIPREYRQ